MRDERLALRALNWCAGCGAVDGGQVNQIHGVVRELVRERGHPDSFVSEEEAARALLRDRAGYDPGIGNPNVSPFDSTRVALPDDTTGAPLLEEVLPPRAMHYVEGDYTRMLKSEIEMLELQDHAEEVRPYMDEVLRWNKNEYAKFVHRLLDKKMLQLTVEPREEVTMFFVKKKCNALRMVIDCRRPNRRFRRPPGVSLATPEAMAALECTAADGLWMAEADVDTAKAPFG